MTADSAALLTIEQRIRAQVSNKLSQAFAAISAYIAATVREDSTLTGHELLSRPDVHGAIVTAVTGAGDQIETAVRAGYLAAAKSARITITRELAEHGYQVPEEDPDESAFLTAVIAGLTAAFAAALLEIQETVRAAYDGIAGTAAAPARILAVYEAVNRALRRLSVRVNAATTVAVNRGFTEAQHNIYTAYQQAHPSIRVTKRWQTTSDDPCPACKALNGTVLPLDAEFDPTASTASNWRPPKVYRDLLGPPRHPNCRCRLVYEPTDASTAVRAQTSRTHTPTTVTRLSAAEIRQMPTGRFRALVAFFAAAGRKLTTLMAKVRAGG